MATKKTRITKSLLERIAQIAEPFNTEESVYLYLIKNKFINFELKYFKKIMTIYKYKYKYKAKKVYKSKNLPEVISGRLSKMEYAFCEEVYNLKDKTIYSVYKALYEQSLEHPDVALKFLKLYDRKEKKYNETIKSKNTNINSKNDNIYNNKKIIEKNMNEINLLLQNAQDSNNINITDSTENYNE